MRWPIQSQLLVPMLTVVVLAIALASLGNAYFDGRRARQTQEENLGRVVATLTEARSRDRYVLKLMNGFSAPNLSCSTETVAPSDHAPN